MKWDDVQIIDQNDEAHRGIFAKLFVAANCQPLAMRTTKDDVIIVNTRASPGTADNKEVRSFLFSNLLGKAKSVKFFKGNNFQRESLPLARAILNVVNSNPAKLKVKFIYKRDPEDTSEPILLKDSKITVKALREGLNSPLTAVSDNGVADFGEVFPGKYKITAEYPDSDECKYDWIVEMKVIVLEPSEDETVVFQVEPLYQQVQFIAHCLLTIPEQIFREDISDSDKVEITGSDGKRTFKFKQKPIDLGLFKVGDLRPVLPTGEVKITNVNNEGVGKLTLGKKTTYWQLGDLDMTDSNLKMVVVGEMKYQNTYDIKIKKEYKHDDLANSTLSNEMFEIQLPPSIEKVEDPKYYLRLKEKKNYWTFDELEEKDKTAIKFDEFKIGRRLPNSPNVYEVEFKPGFTMPVQMPGAKAIIRQDDVDKNKGTLLLSVNRLKVNYWKLEELNASLDPTKIEIVRELVSTHPKVYEIKFKKKGEFYSEKDLKGKWKATYHGFVDDEEDIEARVKFVKETIDKAYDKSDKNPVVLKVFMIPECFFQGLYGAYLTDDAAKLVEKLQLLVKASKWKDWVFSFGTVNRVYLGLQPKSITTEQKIYEMANHAPVIRGGLGDSGYSGGGSTRLIQKLVNSAELADDDTLIKDPRVEEMRIKKDKKYRPQAVNDFVQFEATENDIKVASFLLRLLEADIPDSFGLPGGLWGDLKREIKELIKELGIARVVRQIRIAANQDVDNKDLNNWVYCAKDPQEKSKVVDVLYRTQKTCLPNLDQAVLMVIKALWKNLYAREFTNSDWADETVKRKELLMKDSSIFDNAAKECGFRMPYQQAEIFSRIKALKVNEPEAVNLVAITPAQPFEPSVFPIWRKLLELYARRIGENMPLDFVQSGMKLEDYCFAGPRKAGSWFANLNEAKKVKACKRMVFGLEICADHPTKRLFELNQGSNEKTEPFIPVDLQLLPSAGMSPNYYGVRKGGYIFNCDGWNKAHPDGGKSIKVCFDGPQPLVEGEEITTSPVYPHSAVGKRTSDSMEVPSCLKPTVEALDSELSKVIFEQGPGELHFYPLQDLPK